MATRLNFQQIKSIVPNMDIFRADTTHYSFVITHEKETGHGFKNWTGFAASWKDQREPKHQQSPTRINKKAFDTFEEAKKACEKTLEQLLRKQQ